MKEDQAMSMLHVEPKWQIRENRLSGGGFLMSWIHQRFAGAFAAATAFFSEVGSALMERSHSASRGGIGPWLY
jgi:hypothetical protein